MNKKVEDVIAAISDLTKDELELVSKNLEASTSKSNFTEEQSKQEPEVKDMDPFKIATQKYI